MRKIYYLLFLFIFSAGCKDPIICSDGSICENDDINKCCIIKAPKGSDSKQDEDFFADSKDDDTTVNIDEENNYFNEFKTLFKQNSKLNLSDTLKQLSVKYPNVQVEKINLAMKRVLALNIYVPGFWGCEDHGFSKSYLKVKMYRIGDNFFWIEDLCSIESSDFCGASATYSAEYINAQRGYYRFGRIEKNDTGVKLLIDPFVNFLGMDKDGADIDHDGDGYPGVTVAIKYKPLAMSGQRYFSSKEEYLMTVENMNEDIIFGRIKYSINQNIFEESSSLFKKASNITQDPNKEKSYFIMKRADGPLSCDRVKSFLDLN